jgi:tetratricopeptide (TPR) repeat protein
MRRALAITEAALGPAHPTVAIRLNNLASLLQATGRLAEAEPLYRRALASTEAALGPAHPAVATGLGNLASLLKATGRLAEAEPLMRRMVDIFESFERSTGHRHPHYDAALENMAALEADIAKARSGGASVNDLNASDPAPPAPPRSASAPTLPSPPPTSPPASIWRRLFGRKS